MTEAKEIQLGNLGGSSSQDSISSNSQDLVINIPEELQGHGIVVNYGASWISNLSVNDSNNTVTGTVAANDSESSRSTTITLTASGNLSTTSPYSFTLTQSGKYVNRTRKVGIMLTVPPSTQVWRLNGSILADTFIQYDLNSPSISTSITISTDDSSAISNITMNGNFSYQKNGNWMGGMVESITPSSLSFAANEYGTKWFQVIGK